MYLFLQSVFRKKKWIREVHFNFLPQYCLILDFTLPHKVGKETLQMVLHGALVLLFAPFTKFLHALNILNVHTSCQLDKVVLVVDFHIPETFII